jgi:hypothetical protein
MSGGKVAPAQNLQKLILALGPLSALGRTQALIQMIRAQPISPGLPPKEALCLLPASRTLVAILKLEIHKASGMTCDSLTIQYQALAGSQR